MKTKSKRTLTPKLRFPEFRDKGEWKERKLAMLTEPVTDRVGDLDCVPYTVTSGEGLISQEEKYGRTIAGKSLKNYYRLKRDDFAFNKSATKSFPQGYIARFQENERAAVPNSIFTCFRIADANIDATYLDYLFQGNLHGRWLKDYITVGARAHGALNISDDDLYALPIPLPAGDEIKAEQQKIADCLGSLDGLIAAEGRKLAALRDHKHGLMQQLFPQPGQTQPRLRFPEFRDKGGWENEQLGSICKFVRGPFGGALKKEIFVSEGFAVYEQSHAIHGRLDTFRYFIDEDKYRALRRFAVKANDIIMSCSGTMGCFTLIPQDPIPGVINQALLKLTVGKSFNTSFILCALELPTNLSKLLSQSAGGAIKNVVGVKDLKAVEVSIPRPDEQQKIADCLTALDTRIAAQAAKIDTLKQHKRGLMQQLFPAPEEP